MNIKIFPFLFLILVMVSSMKSYSQDNKEINNIISKKVDYNKSHRFGNGFRIQLYNGSETRAYEVKSDYEVAFNEVAELSYESPEWKVRVGHFLTKLEADRALAAIKEKFKSAIVLETTIRL